MVPLVDVAAVEDTATIKEVIELIDVKGHSRIPVYHERIDNIIGVINSFDLLDISLSKRPLSSLIRTVSYVPEVKPVDDLLIEMQKQRTHLAIVVDEYGGSAGIIAIEDILEEIVGEIEDEYDPDKKLYRKIRKNNYIVSSRMEVDQIVNCYPSPCLRGIMKPWGDFSWNGLVISQSLAKFCALTI